MFIRKFILLLIATMLHANLQSSVRCHNMLISDNYSNYSEVATKIDHLYSERHALMVGGFMIHVTGIEMAVLYAQYNQNLAWTVLTITATVGAIMLKLGHRPKYKEINTMTEDLNEIINGDNDYLRDKLLTRHQELLLKDKNYTQGYVANQIEKAIKSRQSNNYV